MPGDLTDSHAHLDLLKDPDAAVDAARQHGIARIMTVGCDLDSSRRAVELASRHHCVTAATGIHPHNAGSAGSQMYSDLKELARSPDVVAVGEAGLDFYRDLSPRAAQEESFRRQIEIARQVEKPLIVHTRDASQKTLDILEECASGLTVVMHCFSLYEHVEECVERGYYMSVAGNVTYENAGDLRRAAAQIPSNLLLTETDCPYLSPAPRRGRPNSPENVRYTLKELAQIRNANEDKLAEQVKNNFSKAFGV